MIEQPNTIIAFDTESIGRMEGLSLSIAEPASDPANPILPYGTALHEEWVTQFMGTVLRHEGRYRMWYLGWDRRFTKSICHAVSADGRRWTRPALGLSTYRGSRNNNIVAGLPKTTECVDVLLDRDERGPLFMMPYMDIYMLKPEHARTAARRKELLGHGCGAPTLAGIANSRDGLRWRMTKAQIPPVPEWLECGRLYKVDDTFILNAQQPFQWGTGKLRPGRCVSFWSSKDLRVWRKHSNSFQNPGERFATHVGIVPIKRAGRLLVGLGGVFLTPYAEIPDQHFEIALMASYNGLDWRPVKEGLSYIRRGVPGSWDAGGVEQGQGLVEIGDDAYIYYGGTDTGNLPPFGRIPQSHSAIGRVRLQRDRFASLALRVQWDFQDRPNRRRYGYLLTKPVTFNGDRLALNADNLSKTALLKVALCWPDGRVVPGYGEEQCFPLTAGGVTAPVRWEERAVPAGQYAVRVGFYGGQLRQDSPCLYAIYYGR